MGMDSSNSNLQPQRQLVAFEIYDATARVRASGQPGAARRCTLLHADAGSHLFPSMKKLCWTWRLQASTGTLPGISTFEQHSGASTDAQLPFRPAQISAVSCCNECVRLRVQVRRRGLDFGGLRELHKDYR